MPPPPGGATTSGTPRGSTSPDFFIAHSSPRHTVQTTMKDDIFPLPLTESPSHALNLVGRRLLPGESCSQQPSSQRPRVGLLLLVAPPDRDRANSTANFSAKNIETRPPSAPPPHCNSIIPPSPAAPLNYIQRVILRLRGDIEVGTWGFMVINCEILFYFILFFQRVDPLI